MKRKMKTSYYFFKARIRLISAPDKYAHMHKTKAYVTNEKSFIWKKIKLYFYSHYTYIKIPNGLKTDTFENYKTNGSKYGKYFSSVKKGIYKYE